MKMMKMKQNENIIFPENVEVGKFYNVPHVYVPPGKVYSGVKGIYMPILTHLHEDKKVIKADFYHWHIDWRFVNGALYNQIIVKRDNLSGPAYSTMSTGKAEAANIVIFGEHQNGYTQWSNNTNDKTIYYRRVKCKRETSISDFYEDDFKRGGNQGWVMELPKKFKNSKLKECDGVLICPHKGAHINKNCKDEHGNYICPAHLLRFDPITLKVVPNHIKEPA